MDSQRISNSVVNVLDPILYDAITREALFFHLLDKKGEKRFNVGGRVYQWTPLTQRIPATDYADGVEIDFARRTEVSAASLPFRQVLAGELLTNTEVERGHGKFAVEEIVRGVAQRVKDGLISKIARSIYNDGGGNTGEAGGLHGLESMMSATGGTTTEFATNNDTYAGISTAATGITSDTQDDGYEAWSPVVSNATSTFYGGGGDTWTLQGELVARSVITKIVNRNGGRRDNLVMLVNLSDWNALITRLETAYDATANWQVNARDPDLVSLGFSNQLRFDGVLVMHDQYVPANKAYVVDLKKSCVIAPSTNPIITRSERDARYDGNLVYAKWHGNFAWKLPACFGKIITG